MQSTLQLSPDTYDVVIDCTQIDFDRTVGHKFSFERLIIFEREESKVHVSFKCERKFSIDEVVLTWICEEISNVFEADQKTAAKDLSRQEV